MDESFFDKHKGLLVEVIVKQAMAALVIKSPWLAFKPAYWLVSRIIALGIRWALDYTIIGVNFILIDWEKNRNLKAFRSALDEIDQLPPDATPEQKEVIDEKIISAARDLIRLNERPRL